MDNWQSVPCGPFFPSRELPPEVLQALEPDDVQRLRYWGGREGFCGRTWLRLFRFEELAELNWAFEAPRYFPEVLLFGSNGMGEAFALHLKKGHVLQVPFIPLMAQEAERRAPSLEHFLASLAATGPAREPDAQMLGHELHAKQPLCMGGSPTDPDNRVYVSVPKYAEVCRFWNEAYRNALSPEG